MCFCCCATRKPILIYAIVISSFAFIYGIITISKFGSKTDIYKALISRIKELENEPDTPSTKYNNVYSNGNTYNDYYYKIKNNNTRRINNDDDYLYPYYNNYYTNSKFAEKILNSESYLQILSLTKDDINNNGYGFIKRLKGIENGLGTILFIFPLLFLIIEIVFLIFSCGIKEFKILPDNTFNIFNIIKIMCITFSTIFIFLSALYGVLLVWVFCEYICLIEILDSCATGIILGMIYGYYGLWYYIILSCAFCKERTHFLNVGCESKPGPEAKYDINGNPIVYNQQTNLQPKSHISIVSQPVFPQNPVIFAQQNKIGDGYITVNGILYKKVDNASSTNIVPIENNNGIKIPSNSNRLVNEKNNNEVDNPPSSYVMMFNERKNKKRNSVKKNTNKKRHSKSNIQINNFHDNVEASKNEENN